MEESDDVVSNHRAASRSPFRSQTVSSISFDDDDYYYLNAKQQTTSSNNSGDVVHMKSLAVLSASEDTSQLFFFDSPPKDDENGHGHNSSAPEAVHVHGADNNNTEAADTSEAVVAPASPRPGLYNSDEKPSLSSILKADPRYSPLASPRQTSSPPPRPRIETKKRHPLSDSSIMLKRSLHQNKKGQFAPLSLSGLMTTKNNWSTGGGGIAATEVAVQEEESSSCVANGDVDDQQYAQGNAENNLVGESNISSNSTGMLNRVQKLNPFNAVGAMMAFKRGVGGLHLDETHDTTDGSGRGGADDDGEDEVARARLGLLLSACGTSSKKLAPPEVRARRAERLSQATASTASGEEVQGDGIGKSTKLHELCAGSDTTLLHLQTELAKSPTSASTKDSIGRLPLHVLGDNMDLISTTVGKSIATTFALQLMRVFPEAITTPDAFGFFPFVSLIQDWEQWSYESPDNKAGSSKVAKLFERVAGGVVAMAGMELSRSLVAERRDPVTSTTRDGASSCKPPAVNLFPRVDLWEEVVWCFEMLSLAMDELGGKNGGLNESENDVQEEFNQKDREARSLLSQHLPLKMPSIVKTVLLVDRGGGDEAGREKLLQSSIFRATLLQPESVGDWLTLMIRNGGLVSKRAIDYLALVSETTIDDFVGGFRPSLPLDKQEFHFARTDVFNAVNELEGTVASLVILEEREIERAVSTSVINYIISKNLSRPFVVSVSLIDFVLQIVLLLAFRNQVSAFGNEVGPQVPTSIVYFICFHYVIRKGSESIALFNLSPKVFRSYFLNLWNVFDILAIITVFVAFVWNQANRNSYRNGFNTFVLGLLWLKILAFMKVVNKEMSTFIIALGRILKDLVYFAIVLLVVILMFGDMFRIAITTKDNGDFCRIYNATEAGGDLQGPMQDFCNPDFMYSVLRTYALLLGDFSLDEYKETPGMVILFVIFTAIGVIILLNVLIAVISDSYEVAKLSSHRLFGKARVGFVAQNQALESFLKPGANPLELWNIQSPTKALLTGFTCLRRGVLMSLVVTAMFAEFFLVAQAIDNIVNMTSYLTTIFVVVLGVVLTCALWILVFFAVGGVAKAVVPGFIGRVVMRLDKWTSSFSKFVASRLFGLSKSERTAYSIVDEDDGEDEWLGRITYLERTFDRAATRIHDELKAEMVALENRLYERLASTGGEARASESSVSFSDLPKRAQPDTTTTRADQRFDV